MAPNKKALNDEELDQVAGGTAQIAQNKVQNTQAAQNNKNAAFTNQQTAMNRQQSFGTGSNTAFNTGKTQNTNDNTKVTVGKQ